MSRLLKRIDKLRKTIKENHNNINNETTTRYVLIDPVLRDLGWPLDDPTKIRYEEGEGGRWDYNLANRLLIEAKKLGGINTKHEKQLINYLRKNKMKHGVLTDGNIWIKFTVHADNHDEDFRITISSGNSVFIHKKLSDLSQYYVMNMIKSVKPYEPPNPYNGTPISEFQPSGKLPVKLVCQDDKPVICNRWRDILIGVAAHLVDQKYVKESDCPLLSGPKTAILNTHEYNQTGTKMRDFKIVRPGFYLNTNLNAVGIISNTKKIIKLAELEPQNFMIIQHDDIKLEETKLPTQTLKQTNDGMPISEFQPSGKLPVKLVCQDDKPVICNRWRDILIGVAAHLVDQKYVKESDCPMPPKLKNPLIITKISHLNKSKIEYRQIPHSGFYVNVNFSRVGIIKNAIKLIKNSKLSPQDFKITTA